jgi:hypothetical protein
MAKSERDEDETTDTVDAGPDGDALELDDTSLRLLTKMLYNILKQEVRLERERLGR